MSYTNPLDPQQGILPVSSAGAQAGGEGEAERCPDALEVVEVVELRRREEGQVVAAVRNACDYESKGQPRCD